MRLDDKSIGLILLFWPWQGRIPSRCCFTLHPPSRRYCFPSCSMSWDPWGTGCGKGQSLTEKREKVTIFWVNGCSLYPENGKKVEITNIWFSHFSPISNCLGKVLYFPRHRDPSGVGHLFLEEHPLGPELHSLTEQLLPTQVCQGLAAVLVAGVRGHAVVAAVEVTAQSWPHGQGGRVRTGLTVAWPLLKEAVTVIAVEPPKDWSWVYKHLG